MNADLSQLKDLHIPTTPSVWPLAAGWWLVLLGLLFVFILVCVIITLYWTGVRRAIRREFKQLKRLPDKAYLPAVNRLLKRVAMRKDTQVASWYGDKWFNFLNQTKGVHFTQEDIALFAKRLYTGSAKMSSAQRKHIHRCASVWLKHNL
ncbi:MAG: DUF4381 domain-containing protein [Alphaproteobacteria bacterium]|nr:DUF4381 domain-containing protein [Alphaproteobacteria bacterium]